MNSFSRTNSVQCGSSGPCKELRNKQAECFSLNENRVRVFLTNLGWILNTMKSVYDPKNSRENHRSLTSLFSEGQTGCEPTSEPGKAAEETAPKWYFGFFFRKLCCGCSSHCGVFILFVMTCKRDSSQLQQHGMCLLAAHGVMGEFYPFPVLVLTSKILQVAGGAVRILVYPLVDLDN